MQCVCELNMNSCVGKWVLALCFDRVKTGSKNDFGYI